MKGKNLIIVESPGKVKTIGGFLGSDFLVTASKGHIRDLEEKKLGIDINNGFMPEYIIPADKKKTVEELKALTEKAETVWLASDEDREGEAISWHLYDTLGLKKENTKRIVFHEITKPAILDAIEHPRDIDMNLVNAQQARRVLDRLVGFEISPILWRKIQPKLSAGRVQSVALRLIVDREKEIMDFENKPYYRIDAVFIPEGTSARVKATLENRFNSLEEARKYLEDSAEAAWRIDSMEQKEGTRFPATPFTTSTLQQEAARKLHFPVSVTMRVAQTLYERGLITYMRTDSTNLSKLAIASAKQYITDNYGEQYSSPRQFKTRSKGAQEAHEAIRPSYISRTEIEGTAQEQKLYELIWKRTVASQMSDARVLNTAIRIGSDHRDEKFAVQASQVLFDGFLKVYIEGRDDEAENNEDVLLPELHEGNALALSTMSAECKFTAAPPRFSEATLIKKLEELGIGRPSTYEPTIRTLMTRNYIVKGDKTGRKISVSNLSLTDGKISSKTKQETVGAEKGKLLPQEIGIIVTDYLVKNFPKIIDYDFTARVEEKFDEIAEGKVVWNSPIATFYKEFHAGVESALSNKEFSKVTREIGRNPETGELIVAKYGQWGPYVQMGEAENKKFASLENGQLIEDLTLEDALKLFALPRTVGSIDGVKVVATKGRFGPYLKYGEKNVKLPRGADPLKITIEQCKEIILGAEKSDAKQANTVISDYADGKIQVISGRYGPYIKSEGANYRIPKGARAETLTREDCERIIRSSQPTGKSRKWHKK